LSSRFPFSSFFFCLHFQRGNSGKMREDASMDKLVGPTSTPNVKKLAKWCVEKIFTNKKKGGS
jgi:hypothetical protein